MFVPPVARQKSRANAPKRPADVAQRGPGLQEHGDLQQEKVDAGAQDVGQGWNFGKIPLFSSGSGDSFPVQAKLKVGAVHDPLEHEADRVAEQALHVPEADSSNGGAEARTGAMRPRLRAEAAAKPQDWELTGSSSEPASGPAPDSFRGRGSALPGPVRGFFERRFQYGFGDVRVHDGPDAAESARGLGARAYTWGRDIVFGAGEYLPGKANGTRLLGHELAHVVQQGPGRSLVQRSPLSDSVKKDWDADPKIETLLARLGQADVQNDQKNPDLDAMVKQLATKPDDLWVAQQIRNGELGETSGKLDVSAKEAKEQADAGYKATQRPIKVFFFKGKTDRHALVIAGVHGSERQGMEVADRLIHDLQNGQQAVFSAIIVPSLFPDNAAAKTIEKGKDGSRSISNGLREGNTPTNRNFPQPSEDLDAATKAGGGTAKDAQGRKILPENQMLMQLIEKFHPERIISLHGTSGPGSAGAFYDPRKLRPDEVEAARDWARGNAYMRTPRQEDDEAGGEAAMHEMEEGLFRQRLAEMAAQANDTDRDLSLNTAKQIDAATAAIPGRGKRQMSREKEDPKVTAAEKPGRLAHPSIAGNVGPTGAIDNSHWSGSTPGGISLGGYAPPRGISTFTVEPALNFNSDDYAKKTGDVSQANRKIELQAYSDAVRTILLGS